MKRLREFKSLLGVLAALALWEAMSLSGVFPQSIFPPPQMVLAAGIREFQEGLLLTHIGVSMARLFAGFLIGSIIGVLLGILMGWVKWVENLFNPLIEIVRPVPPLAWIPLAIFWFGIGEVSKLFMISLAVFFFVVVNTYQGVANVDFVLIRASQSLNATRRQILFQVILPATMPDIATGLRLGLSIAFALLAASELIAAKSGLGFMIMNAREMGNNDTIIFGILVVGTLAVVCEYLFNLLMNKKILRWHAALEKEREEIAVS
jgi:ABC-type nitrate/sulfonate/bicarbonate transport system permease component